LQIGAFFFLEFTSNCSASLSQLAQGTDQLSPPKTCSIFEGKESNPYLFHLSFQVPADWGKNLQLIWGLFFTSSKQCLLAENNR